MTLSTPIRHPKRTNRLRFHFGFDNSQVMGLPCLRVNGDFFASADYRSGDLIVKLPADRVPALIDGGDGEPFAPNGRRFREWVRVVERDAGHWETLIAQAETFVSTKV